MLRNNFNFIIKMTIPDKPGNHFVDVSYYRNTIKKGIDGLANRDANGYTDS